MISDEIHKKLQSTHPIEPQRYVSNIAAVDAILNGKLVSGHSITWRGHRSCGKTAVLRAIVNNVRRQGISVAWINPGHDLLASDWHDAFSGHLWMVRPPLSRDVLFCAEIILRTQSFGILIIDEPPKIKGNQALRLRRLARQNSTTIISIYHSDHGAHSQTHAHFKFEARAEPIRHELCRRQPFSWYLTACHTSTASPMHIRSLQLNEAPSHRLIKKPATSDRSTTQVKTAPLDNNVEDTQRLSQSEEQSDVARLISFSRHPGDQP